MTLPMPRYSVEGRTLMNAKLNKVLHEIEKTKAKLDKLNALLPELEKQRKELENAEVVTIFRSLNVPFTDYADFMKAYKDGTLTLQHENDELHEAHNTLSTLSDGNNVADTSSESNNGGDNNE
jgi:hypothetical protein